MSDPTPFSIISEQPLTPEIPPRPTFAQRIQRAHHLSEQHSSSSELLRFYASLVFHQQHVFDSLSAFTPDAAPPSPREQVGGTGFGSSADSTSWPLLLDSVIPLFSDFARSLADISPAPMQQRAAELASVSPLEQTQLLTRFWNGGFAHDENGSLADRFIALAYLQPYAEWLAQSGYTSAAANRHATCPICGSEPVCAVFRDQVHGARRSLICSLCMNEWMFQRMVCPACGEDRVDSLPVFTPQEAPHIRIDACETCHHYIKTIDMTKDGLAVPVVDELAAVSLDLWAADNGYHKLTPNLAGI